jgi:monoamine oxidase
MNIMNFDKKEKENEKNILPIIIIGSGVSGLTIASKIKDKNFLILEARDRIGGRVFTNEKNMDMGAAWIHGSDNNPLNKYLNFDNLLPISNSNPWMHSENIPINYLSNKYNITEEKRQQLASIWNELATKIGNKHDKTIIQGLEEIKEENTDEYNKNNDLFSFLYMIEVWCGGSIKNVSTSFLNEAK